MKITFEPEDADLIANRVIELLKPVLKEYLKEKPDETIMTPDTLAEYLRVHTSWVYKQVASGLLPFFRAGRYIRFKRSAIDRWMDEKQGGVIAYTPRPRR